MPKNFTKKKLAQKLGFRTPDFFKRQKKHRLERIFVKPIKLRGGQHRG